MDNWKELKKITNIIKLEHIGDGVCKKYVKLR